MKTKIFYSLKDLGDGSVCLRICESKELAELDQEYEENEGDGFAEDCSGSITVEHSSPIKILDEIITVKGEIQRITRELDQSYMKEYKSKGEYPDWFKGLETKLMKLKGCLKQPDKKEGDNNGL